MGPPPALGSQLSVLDLRFDALSGFWFGPNTPQRRWPSEPRPAARLLDPPAGTFLSSCLPPEAVHGLGEHRFRRGLSSWSNLVLVAILAAGPPSRLLCDTLAGRHSASPEPYVPDCRRDFDSSLGFPGKALQWTFGYQLLSLLFASYMYRGGHFFSCRRSPTVGLEH